MITRFGETCLLYAGRLNEIHAEPSVGKRTFHSLRNRGHRRWRACALHRPLISPSAPSAGLAALGADIEMVIEKFHHLHNSTSEVLSERSSGRKRESPPLLSLTDWLKELTAEQKDENAVNDALAFFRCRCKVDEHSTLCTSHRLLRRFVKFGCPTGSGRRAAFQALRPGST